MTSSITVIPLLPEGVAVENSQEDAGWVSGGALLGYSALEWLFSNRGAASLGTRVTTLSLYSINSHRFLKHDVLSRRLGAKGFQPETALQLECIVS